ncbi:MAG: cyclic nucleotide-binding domain-containing protein [Treponema sp.]|jgi:CRP-like cAMP-binding protein|nr:cyclic nucleotide-binding domain-containing protein [Treponema sp.]
MATSQNLQDYSLFGFLDDDQVGKVYSMMQHESYCPGESIIREGESNDRIRFIISGQVAVVKENIILSEFSEGDAFGEIEVLDTLPSEATIKALTATEVMSLTHQCLKQIAGDDLKTFSIILMNLARDLCRRLRRMDVKFTDRWE